MNPLLASFFATAGFFLSLIAISIAYRKDVHSLRLEETPHQYWTLILGINNDAACDTEVLSIGYFYSEGDVVWIDRACDYSTNKLVEFPMVINARSMRPLLFVAGRDVPKESEKFGYCVQLSTGRVYVLCKNVSFKTKCIMHFGSALSRITRGGVILSRFCPPRIPLRSY